MVAGLLPAWLLERIPHSIQHENSGNRQKVGSSTSGITSLRSLGVARDTAATASPPLDDVLGHFLCVAEQHHGVVAVEQRIVDAGIARSQRTLDEHHGAGLPHLQYGHAVNR